MLNIVGVASAAPSIPGAAAAAAAAAAVKGGSGDGSDGSQFADMLGKLAAGVALPDGPVAPQMSVAKALAALMATIGPADAGDAASAVLPAPTDASLGVGVGTQAVGNGTSDTTVRSVKDASSQNAGDDRDASDVAVAKADLDTANALAAVAVPVVPVAPVVKDPQPVTEREQDVAPAIAPGLPMPMSKTSKGPAMTAANAKRLASARSEDPAPGTVSPDENGAGTAESGTRAEDGHGAPSQGQPGSAAFRRRLQAVGAAADTPSTQPGTTVSPAPDKDALSAVAAAAATSPKTDTPTLRPTTGTKDEPSAVRGTARPKLMAGTPVSATEAAQPATTPTVTAVGTGNAGTREFGERPSGPRPAPQLAPVSAAQFEMQAGLLADVTGVGRASSGRAAEFAAMPVTERLILDSGVPTQIVQAIHTQWSQGVGTARVTLQPDYLGSLSIDIRVDRGNVTAVLDASNSAVRQWIEGHEPLLRQGLADHGLTLDRLIVNKDQEPQPSTSDDGRQGQGQGDDQPRRRRPRPTPTDQTFEVVM